MDPPSARPHPSVFSCTTTATTSKPRVTRAHEPRRTIPHHQLRKMGPRWLGTAGKNGIKILDQGVKWQQCRGGGWRRGNAMPRRELGRARPSKCRMEPGGWGDTRNTDAPRMPCMRYYSNDPTQPSHAPARRVHLPAHSPWRCTRAHTYRHTGHAYS
jgi:hypothetical protein